MDTMHSTDFKTIRQCHKDLCKQIINNFGRCVGLRCKRCPFSFANSTFNRGCTIRYTSKGSDKDMKLLKSAEEFLNLFGDCDEAR